MEPLKQCIDLLAPFLTHLSNLLITDCVVSDCMKMAVVSPLLKKTTLDTNDISNCRPVYNLSFLSKLLERSISHQLTVYLEGALLLPPNQSAYRANHSNETAVLHVLYDLVADAQA